MNKPFSDPGTMHPMSAESVNFKNGMIVTADDLGAAMMYPVALMQSVNRAVFGCGVVCGFELRPDPELCGRKGPCDPCAKEGTEGNRLAYPNFVVEIGRGTALDCAGLPIEICKPVRFDVAPESCGCDSQGGTVCILVRRVSASVAPRGDCCDTGAVPHCSRQRDQVEIRAFTSNRLPDHVCMRVPDSTKDDGCGDDQTGNDANPATSVSAPATGTRRPSLCDCLKTCGDCDCCGEGWVLLGCVSLCEGGIVVNSFDGDEAYRMRRWIKPIACVCDTERTPENTTVTKATTLAKDVRLIEAMKTEDPQILTKLDQIVTTKSQRAVFRAMDVRNLEHFQVLLETRAPMLKEAFGLSDTSDKLDEYLAKVKEMKAKDTR